MSFNLVRFLSWSNISPRYFSNVVMYTVNAPHPQKLMYMVVMSVQGGDKSVVILENEK